jgi:uncharacterized protein (UPF0332 family)
MSGTDFIDFAARIAATYSDAASCRSAISRAYYGAFHLAKSLFDQLGLRPPRNANAHVFVQHRLANCGHDRAAEAGMLLADLYADRLNADYNLNKKEVEGVGYARARVVTARRIQDTLHACETKEACDRIKAGIAAYERKLTGQ